ncbi:cadmium-translocating P-type ATPase [bacterium]|nr:cadmium-translocating P-type ATPase [bacterium]
MSPTSFKIHGMDCAEEIATLKREVGPLVGGEQALHFNLLKGRMDVSRPLDQATRDQVIQAVARAGMKAVLWEDAELQQKEQPPKPWAIRHSRSILCATSGVLALFGLIVHWYASGDFLHALAGSDERGGFPIISIVFFLGSVVTGGWFIAPKALLSARRLRPDMNLLMTVAVIGAMAIGEWFEAATVTFLFALSLLLESWSVGRARRAIQSLMDLAPTTAHCICPHDGDLMEKPVEEVPVGAMIVVRPGEKIPLDGIVSKGETGVNQAPITGESVPVSKKPGDEVFAGTINGDGVIEFHSTREANDTTFARIIRMVEEAQSRRARSEQWVEKFARVYTPIMMGLAALIILVPPLILGGDWGRWFYEGLVVLVIACPCALVISTPVSIVAGLAASARMGVLIKGGVYLEIPGRLRALALDKTGTLTLGAPRLENIVSLNDHTGHEILAYAAALEQHSTHPLARAILRRADELGQSLNGSAEQVQQIKGRGIEGRLDGSMFWLGSPQMAKERISYDDDLHSVANQLEDAGHSIVVLGREREAWGVLSIADPVREQAAGVIAELKELRVWPVVMLTGDNESTAQAIARQVGIEEYHAGLLPEAKVRFVQELTRAHGEIGMVGDGVNDAPAMASTSLAIAMGAMGSDAAIETADVALMADDLTRIPWLIRHSRHTSAVIRQNIIFALGVKALFLVLALAGIATLWMAIAADMGASLLVIVNALRLLHVRTQP